MQGQTSLAGAEAGKEEARQQWLPSASWCPQHQRSSTTPETAAAAYALKARRAMPSRCWWELFLLPRRLETPPPVPEQGSLREQPLMSAAPHWAAAMHLFSVKGRGTTNNRRSKCTQEKGPKTVWWLEVMPAAGPPSGSTPD